MYDMNGEMRGTINHRAPLHGQSFTMFTGSGGHLFQFFTGDSTHREDSISTKTFFSHVLPNSHHKPYLINFYSDYCKRCAHVEQLWDDMRKVSERCQEEIHNSKSFDQCTWSSHHQNKTESNSLKLERFPILLSQLKVEKCWGQYSSCMKPSFSPRWWLLHVHNIIY